MRQLAETLKGLSILYAEDEPDIRTLTCKTLEMLFGQVFVAKDGVDALLLYEQHRPNMALLDYVMPCADGQEVAKTIRDKKDKMPIIICSGYSDKEKLLGAIRVGVVQYIEKPLGFDALMGALKVSVERLKEYHLLHIPLGDGVSYDIAQKQIYHGKIATTITKQEMQIIETLIMHKSQLVTKEQILHALGEPNMSENALRNIIYRLRKKIDRDIIITVRDIGYLLQVSNNEP